ncbi:hypothetical protein GTQ43_34460 [Nostoc sp. KVJ3]|nr:hypothetical protein [Nostoc sp. KVJ3]
MAEWHTFHSCSNATHGRSWGTAGIRASAIRFGETQFFLGGFQALVE